MAQDMRTLPLAPRTKTLEAPTARVRCTSYTMAIRSLILPEPEVFLPRSDGWRTRSPLMSHCRRRTTTSGSDYTATSDRSWKPFPVRFTVIYKVNDLVQLVGASDNASGKETACL